MTTRDPNNPANPEAEEAPEALELRARPQPVTRINRKVLIGGAAVLLLLISGIVLVALKPPSLRIGSPQELFNVDHKPITDGLSKLPATYDGVRPDKKIDAGKAPEPVVPGVPSIDGAGQRSRDGGGAGREGAARAHGRPGPRSRRCSSACS